MPEPWRVDDYIVNPGDGCGHWYLYNIHDFNDGPPMAEFYDEGEARRVASILNAAYEAGIDQNPKQGESVF